MDVRALLIDGFDRIDELFDSIADGLDEDALNHRPDGSGNPIGWLLWHLARVEDDHVADLAGTSQAWDRWRSRFDLPLERDDTGYGHSTAQVAVVRIAEAELLAGYHRDVAAATRAYLDGVDGDELDRVVDTRWDPPVTAGARLVSVQGDCLQHLGQAAYVRGLLADE